MSSMFCDCSSLRALNISTFDTTKVTSMASMFNKCSSLNELKLLSFDTSSVWDMSCMFSHCSWLRILDLSNFDTTKVTNMAFMFFSCHRLEELDLSWFDMSKVKKCESMFASCLSLKRIVMRGCSGQTVAKVRGAMAEAGLKGVEIVLWVSLKLHAETKLLGGGGSVERDRRLWMCWRWDGGDFRGNHNTASSRLVFIWLYRYPMLPHGAKHERASSRLRRWGEWADTHSDKNVAADAAYSPYDWFTRAYARADKIVAAMRLLGGVAK